MHFHVLFFFGIAGWEMAHPSSFATLCDHPAAPPYQLPQGCLFHVYHPQGIAIQRPYSPLHSSDLRRGRTLYEMEITSSLLSIRHSRAFSFISSRIADKAGECQKSASRFGLCSSFNRGQCFSTQLVAGWLFYPCNFNECRVKVSAVNRFIADRSRLILPGPETIMADQQKKLLYRHAFLSNNGNLSYGHAFAAVSGKNCKATSTQSLYSR